jgi:hypothetical protein
VFGGCDATLLELPLLRLAIPRANLIAISVVAKRSGLEIGFSAWFGAVISDRRVAGGDPSHLVPAHAVQPPETVV